MTKHWFDQASWRIIKEFVGIYGIKMDYSTILKLHVSDIHDAMMWTEIIPPTFIHNYRWVPISWKTLLLKKVAHGYKSRQFYQELQVKIDTYKQNSRYTKW